MIEMPRGSRQPVWLAVIVAACALSGCPSKTAGIASEPEGIDDPSAAGAGGSSGSSVSRNEGARGGADTGGRGGASGGEAAARSGGGDITDAGAADYWSGSGASCVLENLHTPEGTGGVGGAGSQPCRLAGGAMAEEGACPLHGMWRTHSAPWNGMSTDALIDFRDDGTFSGTPEFAGEYCLDGTDLAIAHTSGDDMTCDFDARWTVVFTVDCAAAVLCPLWDNCTGARRYLDWDVSLTRP